MSDLLKDEYVIYGNIVKKTWTEKKDTDEETHAILGSDTSNSSVSESINDDSTEYVDILKTV